ncbi:MAG: hypothetical protein ACM3SR_11340 [Ignavibacteriales bacterium]
MPGIKKFDIQSFQELVVDRLTDLQLLYGSPPDINFSPGVVETDFSRIEEEIEETVELLEHIGYKDFAQKMQDYSSESEQQKEVDLESIGHKITEYKNRAWRLINNKQIKKYIRPILKDERLELPERARAIVQTLVTLNQSHKVDVDLDPMLFAMMTLWGEYINHYKKDY